MSRSRTRPPGLRYLAARLFERSPEVRLLRSHIARQVGNEPVLELGCGFGWNAALCPGGYLGVERDPALLRRARAIQPRGEFIEGDATDPRLALAPRPTVLLCLMLHETEDPRALLTVAAGLCQRRLLLYDYDPGLTRPRRWWLGLWESHDTSRYFRLDIEATLEPLGLPLLATAPLPPEFRFFCFNRRFR